MRNKAARLLLGAGAALLAVSLFLFWSGSEADRRAGESARLLLKDWDTSSFRFPAGKSAPSFPEEESPPASPLPDRVLGVLSLPALGLDLPVLEECTDELLERAPCRYAGTGPQEAGFVVAGHSCDSHFGKLSHLADGDEVLFRDREGGETRFQVRDREFLPGGDAEGLDADAWDLTLFTCTFDGSDRLLVRCTRIP